MRRSTSRSRLAVLGVILVIALVAQGLPLAPAAGADEIVIVPIDPDDIIVIGDPPIVGDDGTITVTDPASVIQTSSRSALAAIEADARARIALIHGVANDSRINHWARGEIRALTLGKIVDIIDTPAGQRTAGEQAVYDHVQELMRQKNIEVRDHSLAEYDEWVAARDGGNACAYVPPAGFVYDGGAACQGGLGGLFSGVDPPSVDQFEAYGVALAYGRSGDASAAAAAEEMARAAWLAGSIGAGVVTGSLAAVFAGAAGSAFSGSALVGVVLPHAVKAGTALGIGAAGLAFAVAVAIVAIAIFVIEAIDVIGQDQIRPTLEAKRAEAETAPDLTLYTQSANGLAQLTAVVLEQTFPEPTPPLGTVPTSPNGDRWAVRLEGGTTEVLANEVHTATWDGMDRTTFLDRGWFVHSENGGPRKLSLAMPYLDWQGDEWTAWAVDGGFVHTREIEAAAAATPGAGPQCTDSSVCFTSDTIRLRGQNGSNMEISPRANNAPEPAAEWPADIVEGQPVTFQAFGFDADGDEISYTWEIEQPADCRPFTIVSGRTCVGGAWSPPLAPVSTSGETVSHTFTDDGTFLVRLTATDPFGASSTTEFDVDVANVAPSVGIEPSAAFATLEGQTVTLEGSFVEPGTVEVVTVSIDWGDGEVTSFVFPQVVAAPGLTITDQGGGVVDFSATHTYLDDPPGSSADYTVTVAATDDDGGTGDATAVRRVMNMGPTVTVNPASGDEGADTNVTGTLSDPGLDGFELRLSWGDGTADTVVLPAGTTDFDLAHRYPDGGTYTVRANASDDDGAPSPVAVASVSIADVAPVLHLDGFTVFEGDEGRLGGSVRDGRSDAFELEIDWGDGTTETVALPAGTTSLDVPHVYRDNPAGSVLGPYRVSATITDDDGLSDTATANGLVRNVAPTVQLDDVSGDEGSEIRLAGTLTDPGADTFDLTVAWGDGAEESMSLPAGTTDIDLTHTYTDDEPGGYDITVTVDDDDAMRGTGTAAATIANVAPTLTVVDGPGRSPTEVRLDGLVADPGDDVHTIDVDWGDGVTESMPLPAPDAGDGSSGFELFHRYDAGGSFEIVVTAADEDGGSTTARLETDVVTFSTIAASLRDLADSVDLPRGGDRSLRRAVELLDGAQSSAVASVEAGRPDAALRLVLVADILLGVLQRRGLDVSEHRAALAGVSASVAADAIDSYRAGADTRQERRRLERAVALLGQGDAAADAGKLTTAMVRYAAAATTVRTSRGRSLR